MPSTRIQSGVLWVDSSGFPIRAHGGSVFEYHNIWYWYGADQYRPSNSTLRRKNSTANRVINVYSSADLRTWVYIGAAFKLSCAPQHVGSCYVDRPRVLHDRTSGNFVLWMKSTPSVAVAVSTSPHGPFSLLARLQPEPSPIGDIGAFYDPISQRGYLIYSIRVALSHPTANSRGSVSRSIRIVELTADLRGLGRVVHTFGYAREAPAPFVDRANRRYYLWTSRATGWRANAAELFTATSITGPWVSLGNPTKHPTSFDSQVSYILAVKKRSTRLEFIYLADRFEPYIAGPMCGAVLCESGRYIWLPIQFASRRGSTPLAGIAPISGNYRDSANLTVSWRDSWNLDDLVGRSIGSSVS
uniref:Glycosyl hydrolase family 43 n=1 Tax=Haptolina ericina TaxID=156174 RepID=A0A7S3AW48_9EUKA|mmetsp:Transcript_35298/g.80056  ORF Transcript_35298/g.80056 Transcript_35298/m.80056 type:complete len:358 (+) Transcript_35298:65-1138(+)